MKVEIFLITVLLVAHLQSYLQSECYWWHITKVTTNNIEKWWRVSLKANHL